MNITPLKNKVALKEYVTEAKTGSGLVIVGGGLGVTFNQNLNTYNSPTFSSLLTTGDVTIGTFNNTATKTNTNNWITN